MRISIVLIYIYIACNPFCFMAVIYPDIRFYPDRFCCPFSKSWKKFTTLCSARSFLSLNVDCKGLLNTYTYIHIYYARVNYAIFFYIHANKLGTFSINSLRTGLSI